MAKKNQEVEEVEEVEEAGDLDEIDEVDEDALSDDIEDEDLPAVLDDEVVAFDDEEDADEESYDEDDEDDEDHDEETAEALEELENQELQLLDEEANEAMLVDEVAEMRAMRREELTLNVDAQSQKDDEFVCQSCFMVKRTSQLANKRKMICFDCVD
ncbi:MAG: DUF4193 family protein [Acidimicrobiia bacterium]